jgi:hypothetical protein
VNGDIIACREIGVREQLFLILETIAL